MTKKQKRIFTKIILYSAYDYLSRADKLGDIENPLHRKILKALEAWTATNRISQALVPIVVEIGSKAERRATKDVNYLMFGLQLLQLVAKEYNVKVRDILHSEILGCRLPFSIPLLKLKETDNEKYHKLKDVIGDSSDQATQLYYLIKTEVKEIRCL